jgi:site-specific DNA recombinase
MRVAFYVRVSTQRQAQDQTIQQQLSRLQGYAKQQDWGIEDQQIYRDEGYSGARLRRPGLDRLRDVAALADLDVVLITTPDRLARKYVHQVLLIQELEQHGCRVEFTERPMSQDPHDQLLLQIRGAVAEYERTLISERMRRGRLSRLRAGQLLPWVRTPFGYQVDPQRPRDPAGLRLDGYGAAIVQQIFAWYLEEGNTLSSIANRLTASGIPTPTGKNWWSTSSIRCILQNPVYTGKAYGNCTRYVPSRRRRSPLAPVGSGQTCTRRPQEEWLPFDVPATITEETYALVQEKLVQNKQRASRNNKHHQYLLRSLVSCGLCRLGAPARTTWDGYGYYVCNGHSIQDPSHRCSARHIPATQLDRLVWEDLCQVLTHPDQITTALQRAQGGEWLPQELQARLSSVGRAMGQTQRQQERLLDAYVGGVLELAEFQCKRQEISQRQQSLLTQERHLAIAAQQHLETAALAKGIEEFCAQVRQGLANATFEQRRVLVELLIDRVIVTDEDVEVRYVVPTSPNSPHQPFCQLRTDYLSLLPPLEVGRYLGNAERQIAGTGA